MSLFGVNSAAVHKLTGSIFCFDSKTNGAKAFIKDSGGGPSGGPTVAHVHVFTIQLGDNNYTNTWIVWVLGSVRTCLLFFHECVARVPVSLLGVWGLRVCSREDHMAVPMVSPAEGVIFGGFTCGVASFRVAGVALRDIQTCFVTCRKSFCVAGAIL